MSVLKRLEIPLSEAFVVVAFFGVGKGVVSCLLCVENLDDVLAWELLLLLANPIHH